jgi:predicted dehydrogenase
VGGGKGHPINDGRNVPGEESKLEELKKQDGDLFAGTDINYNHYLQIKDFVEAVANGTKPLIDLREGRKTVEIITAIYRTTRDNAPVTFPLYPEPSDETRRLGGLLL